MTQQLKNRIQAEAYTAVLEALNATPPETADYHYPAVYQHAKEAAQLGAVQALLAYTSNNQSRASVIGGVNRATTRAIMKRHGLI
jgi:DNA-binding protein Fis